MGNKIQLILIIVVGLLVITNIFTYTKVTASPTTLQNEAVPEGWITWVQNSIQSPDISNLASATHTHEESIHTHDTSDLAIKTHTHEESIHTHDTSDLAIKTHTHEESIHTHDTSDLAIKTHTHEESIHTHGEQPHTHDSYSSTSHAHAVDHTHAVDYHTHYEVDYYFSPLNIHLRCTGFYCH